MVREAERRHLLRLVDVAAVEDDRRLEQLLHALEVGPAELVPLGHEDECVGAFVFLASERLSGYVTGQILEVNGGQYMP